MIRKINNIHMIVVPGGWIPGNKMRKAIGTFFHKSILKNTLQKMDEHTHSGSK